MSYLEYNVKTTPSGLRKVLYVNWAIVVLLAAAASFGFLMLYSVAGGRLDIWAEPQMKRFAVGMVAMLVIVVTQHPLKSVLRGRTPDAQERKACLELAQANDLSLVCRALINSNEFAFLP